MKKIFVVVDYQNDFVDPKGALPVPNADKIWQNIQNRIDSGDYTDIIYTFDTHTPNEYNTSFEKTLFPDIHCEFGTFGWNLFKIKPRNNDPFQNDILELQNKNELFINLEYLDDDVNEYFFTKNLFDIWEGNPEYADWFTETFPKDEVVIEIVGVATEFCVKMNIIGLIARGYKVNLLTDCIAAITDEGNTEALNELKPFINIIG